MNKKRTMYGYKKNKITPTLALNLSLPYALING